MNEIVSRAQELVQEIYKHMSKIETCDAIVGEIEDKDVVFCKENKVVDLSAVIDKSQMHDIRKTVIETIKANKEESEKYLSAISGGQSNKNVIADTEPVKRKSEIINQELEDAAQEVINSTKNTEKAKEQHDKKTIEAAVQTEERQPLTKETLKNMYIKQGMAVKDIAVQLGYEKSTVYKQIAMLGLKKPSKRSTEGFRD